MKYLCLSITAFALVLGACERHSWEDQKDENGIVTEKGTKRLFEAHGSDEGGHGGAHGDESAESHAGGESKGHDKEGQDHGKDADKPGAH